ncbi:MAG: amidohydrolase family protein [Polyangiales bacterium]
MKQYRLPWLHTQRRTDPEVPVKPPMQIGALSNGEVFRADTPESDRVKALILQKADEGARRLGIERREFLASSMGMATTMWALNVASGCGGESSRMPSEGGSGAPRGSSGRGPEGEDYDPSLPSEMAGPNGPIETDGGYFDVPDDPTDPEKVCQKMMDPKDFFIFDIQTHSVNRANTLYDNFLRQQLRFQRQCIPAGLAPVPCFARDEYTRLMFAESDTTVAVLSGLPAVDDTNNPITNLEIAEAKAFINGLAEGTERLVNHHMVLPNQTGVAGLPAQLDAMEKTLDMYKTVGAWKTYPAWSPVNTETNAQDGYFYDDPKIGIPMVQKGLELGVGLFCIHKGLPIPAFSTKYNDPVDIPRVAKLFPEAKFIVYHSAYGHTNNYFEGPYVQGSRTGVNALITAFLENGIKPGSNIFAELGTTWQLVSTLPVVGGTSAMAHVLGKLLKYVGEDNVVWGTDSIWYGSPQSQIESFLAFQISPQFQRQYGYPELTVDIKRKILGLNAARAYGINPEATRCAIGTGRMAKFKAEQDAEWGERRWAFRTPLMTKRHQYWEAHRKNGFRPG